MTSPHDLDDYLSRRSAQIELPHADLDRIRGRARTRRQRRRALRGGLAAVFLLGGVALAVDRPDDGEPVANTAAGVVVPSELEWSVVETRVGLGWSHPIVADDGTVYALSTAAGEDGSGDMAKVLYRASDGGEWEALAGPEGTRTSSIASGGGALYALGTTAAGGTIAVDLAASTDGGRTWEATRVPFDPAAEAPDFPGTVQVTGTEVAVADERTVVAVQVHGVVDVESLLGPDDDPDWWYPTETGLQRAPMCPEGGGSASTTAPPEATTAEDAARFEHALEDPGSEGGPAVDASRRSCDPSDVDGEHRSWADLGVDPSVGALAAGSTVVLAGPTGGELSRVEGLSGASSVGVQSRSLVAAEDGFWLLGYTGSETGIRDQATAWHSTDGTAWSASPLPGVDQGVDLGVVDGRALALSWTTGSLQVHLLASGTTVEVAGVLALDAEQLFLLGWGFGPMGLALVIQEDGGPAQVVTSPDGSSYSVQEIPLAEMAGEGQRATVNGVTVTADAIKVRVNVRDSDDHTGGAPLAQRLYVGTPG